MFGIPLNFQTFTYVFIVLGVIALLIGIFKKTLWICIVSIALIILINIMQPAVLRQVKNYVVTTVNSFIEPYRDDDYKDVEKKAKNGNTNEISSNITDNINSAD